MAQTDEGRVDQISVFDGLLWDLTRGVPGIIRAGIKDSLFCCVKIYGEGQEDAVSRGNRTGLFSHPLLDDAPTTILECERAAGWFRWMVCASARPLRQIDQSYGPDSMAVSGVKLFGYSGTTTGVVACAIAISENEDELHPLLTATSDFVSIFSQGTRRSILASPTGAAVGLKKLYRPLTSTGDLQKCNEAYCRIVCHNLGSVIRAMCEQGVAPDFEGR